MRQAFIGPSLALSSDLSETSRWTTSSGWHEPCTLRSSSSSGRDEGCDVGLYAAVVGVMAHDQADPCTPAPPCVTRTTAGRLGLSHGRVDPLAATQADREPASDTHASRAGYGRCSGCRRGLALSRAPVRTWTGRSRSRRRPQQCGYGCPCFPGAAANSRSPVPEAG